MTTGNESGISTDGPEQTLAAARRQAVEALTVARRHLEEALHEAARLRREAQETLEAARADAQRTRAELAGAGRDAAIATSPWREEREGEVGRGGGWSADRGAGAAGGATRGPGRDPSGSGARYDTELHVDGLDIRVAVSVSPAAAVTSPPSAGQVRPSPAASSSVGRLPAPSVGRGPALRPGETAPADPALPAAGEHRQGVEPLALDDEPARVAAAAESNADQAPGAHAGSPPAPVAPPAREAEPPVAPAGSSPAAPPAGGSSREEQRSEEAEQPAPWRRWSWSREW